MKETGLHSRKKRKIAYVCSHVWVFTRPATRNELRQSNLQSVLDMKQVLWRMKCDDGLTTRMDNFITPGSVRSEEVCGMLGWILTFICCSTGVFCLFVLFLEKPSSEIIQSLLSIPLWSPKWKLHPSQDWHTSVYSASGWSDFSPSPILLLGSL